MRLETASEARGYCCGFFVVVRVHESRSTSSEGDPQLGKFVLSRQVNLNTPGLSQALPVDKLECMQGNTRELTYFSYRHASNGLRLATPINVSKYGLLAYFKPLLELILFQKNLANIELWM